MTWPFFFLLSRSWKNRILLRFRKLRNPRYLVSALAGLVYLYFMFLHQPFLHRSRMPRNEISLDPGALILAETAFAFMLMLAIVFQWFFSNSRTPLFDEAEVQFLFPAPVSRSTLLNYRIAKAQIGLLFGSLISVLVFGRGRLFSNTIFVLITIWAVYFFLYLFRIGSLIEKQDLKRQGIGGLQLRTWILALVLLLLIFTAVSARWFYPPAPSGSQLNPDNIMVWLARIAESGPVFYVLFPFRLLVHPAFASGIAQFLLRLAPVLLMIAAVYGWIRFSNAGFEEAAVGQSAREETASAGRGRRRTALKPRRPPFRLDPDGFAPIGIYWKNLSLLGGLTMRRAMPGLAALAVLSILLIGASGKNAPMVFGSVCAAMAGFLTLMGPVLFRDDLRVDLKNVDLLKTYPIPGWGIVLGEVLAPSTILALLEWLLILLAAGTLPGFEKYPWNISDRIYGGIAAALLMPCLSLIGVLVQNAAVLLLPGWVQLGREHQRGVEAMGQRLISSFATILSLLIAAAPAALLFLVTSVAGYWLVGRAIIPIAALVGALGLLAEAAIGIFLLGRAFDKFDPSKELSS
jgi:ABC-2 type transport system permease protein